MIPVERTVPYIDQIVFLTVSGFSHVFVQTENVGVMNVFGFFRLLCVIAQDIYIWNRSLFTQGMSGGQS